MRGWLPRFIAWLLLVGFLHFLVALPGLLLLRAATLGRWPAPPGGNPRGESWYGIALLAGAAGWAAGGLAVAVLIR